MSPLGLQVRWFPWLQWSPRPQGSPLAFLCWVGRCRLPDSVCKFAWVTSSIGWSPSFMYSTLPLCLPAVCRIFLQALDPCLCLQLCALFSASHCAKSRTQHVYCFYAEWRSLDEVVAFVKVLCQLWQHEGRSTQITTRNCRGKVLLLSVEKGFIEGCNP